MASFQATPTAPFEAAALMAPRMAGAGSAVEAVKGLAAYSRANGDGGTSRVRSFLQE